MNHTPPMMTSGGTIRRARFVKVSTAADNTVLEADANEACFGISTEGGRAAAIPSESADPPEAAQSGEQLEIFTAGMWCNLEIGSGGCTAGAELKSDSDGKGVLRAVSGTTLQNVGAIALAAASEGELCPVQVFRTSVYPALA